ncbi:MAG: M50 family metallopeptidase [Candidatus ainarchaeum sp.]|nr:M50 family metallopeptidase [Candidatus ainarchaeum sp.]
MFLELLFYPGVIIHEFTHFLACMLLGVKVTKVKFGLKESYVQHHDVHDWKTIIIAIAPFLFSNIIATLGIWYAVKFRPEFYFFVIILWLAVTIIFQSVPSKKDIQNVDAKIVSIYKGIAQKHFLMQIPLFLINTIFVIPLKLFTFLMLIFNKYQLLKIVLIVAVFQIGIWLA